jgi:hypothetical protein
MICSVRLCQVNALAALGTHKTAQKGRGTRHPVVRSLLSGSAVRQSQFYTERSTSAQLFGSNDNFWAE